MDKNRSDSKYSRLWKGLTESCPSNKKVY